MELEEKFKNLSIDKLRLKIEEYFKKSFETIKDFKITHYDNGLTHIKDEGLSIMVNTKNYLKTLK